LKKKGWDHSQRDNNARQNNNFLFIALTNHTNF